VRTLYEGKLAAKPKCPKRFLGILEDYPDIDIKFSKAPNPNVSKETAMKLKKAGAVKTYIPCKPIIC
jgi:hypothetical protein